MSNDNKKLEVVFAPGCFDGFEGTQEELDALMKEILALAESGELEERATVVEMDDIDELDDILDARLLNNTNRSIH